jgi:CRISPR system Cascade subunit CasB
LVEGKEHRAWAALSRIHVDVDDDVKALVAGLYATHPEEIDQGNLGSTCRILEVKRDGGSKGDDKVLPTERRFQHLLAAEAGRELFARVTRMVLMAKAQGVPVNYERLVVDLEFWQRGEIGRERTRREWASAFWDSQAAGSEGVAP